MIDMLVNCRTRAALLVGKPASEIGPSDVKELARVVVAICDELQKRQKAVNGAVTTLNDIVERVEEIDQELEDLKEA